MNPDKFARAQELINLQAHVNADIAEAEILVNNLASRKFVTLEHSPFEESDLKRLICSMKRKFSKQKAKLKREFDQL